LTLLYRLKIGGSELYKGKRQDFKRYLQSPANGRQGLPSAQKHALTVAVYRFHGSFCGDGYSAVFTL
jgi:hypothetical protein